MWAKKCRARYAIRNEIQRNSISPLCRINENSDAVEHTFKWVWQYKSQQKRIRQNGQNLLPIFCVCGCVYGEQCYLCKILFPLHPDDHIASVAGFLCFEMANFVDCCVFMFDEKCWINLRRLNQAKKSFNSTKAQPNAANIHAEYWSL